MAVDCTELDALLAKARTHVMTDEEKVAQRESFVRAMQAAGHGMDTGAILKRVVELDSHLGEFDRWGAAVGEMTEERDELRAELTRRGY